MPTLRWTGLISLFAMVFFGLVLPSDGNHGLFSPKTLSFLIAGGTWLGLVFVQRRYRSKSIYLMISSLSLAALLSGWFLLGSIYGITPLPNQVDQFKLFIVTLAVITIVMFYFEEGVLEPKQLFKCAIYANFIYSAAKFLGATLHIFGIMNILTFMQKTGMRFMSMDIHAGIIRLQTSVDIVTPYLVLFVLNSDRLGIRFPKGFRTLYLILATISVFLSFSRYLIAVFLIALALYWITIGPLQQLIGILLAVCAIFMSIMAFGPDNLYKVVEKRFFSLDNYHSDQTRVNQIEALSKEIECFPLLGKGLGAYAPDCIRDPHLLHSYEVQWIAFAMQLGFIGITGLLLGFMILGAGYMIPPYHLPKMTFGGMYALWLVSGFTNPFLISLTSAIMYSLFALAPYALAQEQRSLANNSR